jgi:hypothetical protein
VDQNESKIAKIMTELADGTQAVRANPNEETFQKWEKRIDEAGKSSNSGGEFLLVGIVVFLIMVFSGALFGSQSAVNDTPPQAPTQPYISITNQLVQPVNIKLNDIYFGTISAQASGSFSSTIYPVRVSFEVVRQTDPNGNPIGDYMAGSWEAVYQSQNLTINNIIGSQYFFYLILNNNTNMECLISVNDGYISQTSPGYLTPYTQQVWAGYYNFFGNTNVSLHCNNDYIYFWGLRPNEENGTSIPIENLQNGSGLITFTLNN